MRYYKNIQPENIKIIVTRHAAYRAYERDITFDMIEATVRGGIVEYQGKNIVKFSKKYKQNIIICVGTCNEELIKIITVEIK